MKRDVRPHTDLEGQEGMVSAHLGEEKGVEEVADRVRPLHAGFTLLEQREVQVDNLCTASSRP